MTNPKTAKRAVILSAIAFVLSFAMLVGATLAWFTDSVTNTRNQIVAGNLDVELYHSSNATNNVYQPVESNTELFVNKNGDPILWEPGAESVETFKIANEGTVALKYELTITNYDSNSVNGKTLADALTAKVGGESGALKTFVYQGNLEAGKAIEVPAHIVWTPSANDNDFNLKDKLNKNEDGNYGTSDGQPLWIDLGIKLVATQYTSEEDYEDDQYDKDATYITEVNTEDELQMALSLGGNVELSESITLTKTMNIVEETTAKLNLNGNTLTGAILAPNADLTVENGTITNANANVSAIEITSGKLTLDNVTIDSARHAVRVDGDVEVTINGGTYKVNPTTVKTLHALNVSGTATVNVYDGTFVGPKGTAADSGAAVNVQAGATVNIYGGDFSKGKNNTLASKGTLNVYGGTFDQNPTAFVAAGYVATKNADNTYSVSMTQESLTDAVKVANSTVYVPSGTYTFPAASFAENVTLICEEGTVFAGVSHLNIKGSTVIGATFDATGNTKDNTGAGTGTINGTFKDCTFTGNHALRYCYAGETVVFEECVFDADQRGIHFDSTNNDVYFKDCVINGFQAIGGGTGTVTFEGCTFGASNHSYNGTNVYANINMIDCTFNFISGKSNFIDLEGTGKTLTITSCTATFDGKPVDLLTYVGGGKLTQNTVIVDGAKVLTEATNAALSDVIKNGETKVYLPAGTYTIPSTAANKTLTISGTKDTVISIQKTDTSAGGANMTFVGVTIQGQASGNYAGWGNGANVHFVDCTIEGKISLYGKTASFTNCVFNNKSDYAVWTWGGEDVDFIGCTFNSGGKALLVYGEYRTATIDIVDCVFNDDNTLNTDKAAIEIGSDRATDNYTINISNITVNGFTVNPEGISTNSNIWANKNSIPTDRLNVVIDGVDVY